MRKFFFGAMLLVAATFAHAADNPLTFVVSSKFKDYRSFRAAIVNKTVECPTLVVNAPVPKKEGIYYVPTAAEIKKYGLEDGLWTCCLDDKGEAVYTKTETVYTVSPVETCINGRCYR